MSPTDSQDTMRGPTPGPWTTRDTHDNCTEVSSPLFDDPYHCIANVNARWSWQGPGTDPVQVANAALIAAAPALLEALRKAQNLEDHGLECMYCLHGLNCEIRWPLAADANVARVDAIAAAYPGAGPGAPIT